MPTDNSINDNKCFVTCLDDVRHPRRRRPPVRDYNRPYETAQAILRTLGDEPKPVSEIAEAVGTSMQNTQYHIERLLDASLVDPVDVWYSAKGREMSVYTLTAEKLLVQFGGE